MAPTGACRQIYWYTLESTNPLRRDGEEVAGDCCWRIFKVLPEWWTYRASAARPRSTRSSWTRRSWSATAEHEQVEQQIAPTTPTVGSFISRARSRSTCSPWVSTPVAGHEDTVVKTQNGTRSRSKISRRYAGAKIRLGQIGRRPSPDGVIVDNPDTVEASCCCRKATIRPVLKASTISGQAEPWHPAAV